MTTTAKKIFQLNAKNILLTYPRSEFDLQQFLGFLESHSPAYVCVCSEEHEDGGLHRHAFLQFEKPFRTRNAAVFDFYGHHPNIQSARNPPAALEYVKKAGDFLESGSFLGKPEKETMDELSITAKAGELELGPFLVWAAVNRVMYARDIWHALRRVDTHTINESDKLYDVLDPAFFALLKDRHPKLPGDKAIVLIGASGIGKTVWAKFYAPKPALFCSHTDTLKEFRAGFHKSIIFDDVSFTHTPITNQIALCDWNDPRAVHCRHTVANIPANIFKIFTCNTAPLDIEHEAIARRIYLIRCDYGALKPYHKIKTI